MCLPARFSGPAEAITALNSSLAYLASLEVSALPAAAQAGLLRSLEQAESRYTAARARVLAAFMSQAGYEADGQGSARTWLKWQTQVTTGAAAGAVGWARRLRAHPAIGDALAAGRVSTSWAKRLCEWTDRLPVGKRDGADEILSGAAAGGAHLTDLAVLAQEMYQRTVEPGEDTSEAMDDRSLRLGITFGGAGRAEGDLTPGCAAALSAVLDALGKKAGPEDIRTAAQRRHDALYEACRRLIRGGMLPGRAGQPTQVQVHMSLRQLLHPPATSTAERAWATASSARPGWLTGPEAAAAACDATVIPVVTGQVDWACLDEFAAALLAGQATTEGSSPGGCAEGRPQAAGPEISDCPGMEISDCQSHCDDISLNGYGAGSDNAPGPGGDSGVEGSGATHDSEGHREGSSTSGDRGEGNRGDRGEGNRAIRGGLSEDRERLWWSSGAGGSPGDGGARTGTGSAGCGPGCGPGRTALSPATRQRLRMALLGLSVRALSGPGGLAARLRAGLGGGPLASVSLPLDIGAASETIPAHLRRAAALRHPHCGFPGCRQPASVCDIHHIVPRSRGGPTALHNLIPLCTFHHLVAVHQWGWALRLEPDGTTIATSPGGQRTLRSHGPPSRAA